MALLAVLALPGVAQAAKPITGTLDQAGMTVIAMTRDGRVSEATAGVKGNFRVVPPNGHVTLQLVGRDGVYAGPVVISGTGKTLVMGVHDGVALGRVAVANGVARVVRPPRARDRDPSFRARGRSGRPLGAGVFGRVKVSTGSGATAPGDDADGDGVPNALDVDDDGDLVLDPVDDRAPQGAVAGQAVVASSLRAPMAASANGNGGHDVTADVLDTMLTAGGALTFPLQSSHTYELDCLGASFCRRHTKMPAAPDLLPRTFVFAPKAKVRALQAGHVFVERRKGRALAGMLPYAYAAPPAVSAWADGTSLGAVEYPASDATLGSAANPLVLHPRPDGHVVLQLAIWRPQRAALPGEGDSLVDIGHLRYAIAVDEAPTDASGGGAGAPDPGPGPCSLASYTENDANLAGTGAPAHGVLLDAADDLSADPGRTLVFSVDLTTCLAGAALTWQPKQILTAALRASDASLGFAEQVLTLKLAAPPQ